MSRSRFVTPLFIALVFGLLTRHALADDQKVVIPFDFESTFDDGRYGRMIGDMIWKKLEQQGGFIIPESMLDVRAWSERTRINPNADTSLEKMSTIVRDEFAAEIGIWGKIERAPGVDFDVYDLWIYVADFSGERPQVIYQTKTQTKTVSEIPHVYVKSALDKLYEREPEAVAKPILAAEERWKTAPNLVQGDFEKGDDGPAGWDPLPAYVSRVTAATEKNGHNQVLRFQFPKSVAASTGVLYYSDYFPIEQNATYRFQCNWRTTGSAAKVFIKCYDEMSTRFDKGREGDQGIQRREVYRSQQNLKGPTRTWNVHTEDFTPKHTQYTPQWGRVMLYAYWPEGAVDWDDVVVKQIKSPPDTRETEVRRPSLETKVTTDELEQSKKQ